VGGEYLLLKLLFEFEHFEFCFKKALPAPIILVLRLNDIFSLETNRPIGNKLCRNDIYDYVYNLLNLSA
jgi:hypothetical protein